MAPANSEDKKGTKKKGGTRTRQADAEEETRHNAELEMQIREEMERAQKGSFRSSRRRWLGRGGNGG